VTLFGFGKGKGEDSRALTKQDYAHTTGHSPDSTSVIPTVKDEANDDPGEPTETIAPVSAEPTPAPAPVPAPAPPVAEGGDPVAGDTSRLRGKRKTTRMRLVRVDAFSVTRLTFVASVALMIVATVAAAVFWMVLAATGVWGEINQSVASLLSDDTASFDITDYLGFTRVVGGTLLISGINVILMTALATVGAHLYNLAAALLGGVEATFTDD